MREPTGQTASDRLRRVPWYLWVGALAIVLGPFYVIPSGNPQPADALTVVFLAAVLIRNRGRLWFPVKTRQFVTMIMAFVAWVTVVNTAWAWYFKNPYVFKNALFYAYNGTISLVFIHLFAAHGKQLYRALVNVLFFTIVMQLVLSPLVIEWSEFRQTLFFNNPNQLAYYAVLCASILLAVSQRMHFSTPYLAAYYGGAFLMVLLSVSRAGVLGMIMVVAVAARRRPITMVIVGLVLALSAPLVMTDSGFVEQASERVSDSSSNSDRGYLRLVQYPQYMVLGAGEGTARLLVDDKHELHSNLGTVLFSYGIIGFFLYFGLHYEIVRRTPLSMLGSLLPPALIGVLHQGLRFPLYWVHLVVLLTLWSIDNMPAEEEDEAESDPPEPVVRPRRRPRPLAARQLSERPPLP